MDWSTDSLYGKAKLYAQRAHDEAVDSALFGFWMSLSLELLARAALAQIHPVLLADPKEPDNIQYAFGIIPKNVPKSIQAKALFARCSVFVEGFTDKMSGHCLIIADRRNSELHSGAAAFEGIDNSKWLPSTYEVVDVLLKHLHRDFNDLLGNEHGPVAVEALKGRRETIKKEVQEKLAAARKFYAEQSPEWKAERLANATAPMDAFVRSNRLTRSHNCPVCENKAVVSGETVGRGPARVDETAGTIKREVRVLPNLLRCPFCKLNLSGFQELNEAGVGAIYTIEEQEDPIEFFGIDPEQYVDVDEIVRKWAEDQDQGGYENE
jgi:transcription elongation factor Elf1